jgi:nuclear GTP-binding protein
MQVVQLDSKIKLLDSPGIVFASSASGTHSDAVIALKNAVRTDALSDPVTPATAILHRANKQQVGIDPLPRNGLICAQLTVIELLL